MTRYLLRRGGLSLVVVAGVIVLTFIIARVIPGNPAAAWAGPHATPAEIVQATRHLGLDKPLPQELWNYAVGVFKGNWGTSIHTHRPVLSDLEQCIPDSLELVITGLLIALVFGIPMGLAAARRRGGVVDNLVRAFAVLTVSMPVFWLALILQLIFFSQLHILPVDGEYATKYQLANIHNYTHFPLIDALLNGQWGMFGSEISHLILPAIAIASYPVGVIARMVRANVLEVSNETHVQMLRALGFSERAIFNRFAMRLAWSPVAQVIALVFAYSLVNTFLVEAIFDWPGLGSYASDAIIYLDIPAIVGITLFVALVYVIANLAVDLVQAALDPRIRLW